MSTEPDRPVLDVVAPASSGTSTSSRPTWRDAGRLGLFIVSCLLFLTSSPTDFWRAAVIVLAVGVMLLSAFQLVRSRVVVDAAGVSIRRFRTRSWAWSDIELLHRDRYGLGAGEPEERQSLVLVPWRGRRQPLEAWHPSARREATAEFRQRALAIAVEQGIDTTPPVPSRAWWERIHPAVHSPGHVEPDPPLR